MEGGPCIAKVVDDDAEGGTRECGRSVSSCWYGKGKLYCASHRTAWNKSKAQADDAEEPSYLDDMTEVIGTRYCEPSKMKPAEKYNSIKKTSLQFCVQGTFIPEKAMNAAPPTRAGRQWMSLWPRSAARISNISRQNTSRSFRRASSATQSASRRLHSSLVNEPCFCIQMYDNCITIVNKFGVSLCTLVFE